MHVMFILPVFLVWMLAVEANGSIQHSEASDGAFSKITNGRTKRDTFYHEIHLESHGDVRKQDKKPNITCPSIPTSVYTEEGKVAISVTWNKATATNHEGRPLKVIQTEGLLPGSVHPEGKYTITYISRDSDGLVAFCSVTFSVIVRRCPFQHLYVQNGEVRCEQDRLKSVYGSKCSYSCQTGYRLVGATTASCQSDSTWSANKPSCKAVTCGSPDAVEQGILVCNSTSYDFNAQCLVSCDLGYTLADQKDKLMCQANTQWSNHGKCQVKRCSDLQTPENSLMSCTKNNTHSSECTVSCLQPYDLEGEATRTCQSNGTWSGKQPECFIKCMPPTPVANGHFVCGSGHKYQDICTLQCDPGFSAIDPLIIKCQLNKTWTQAGICADTQAPTFPYGCVADIDVIAARLGNPTYVKYPSPKVTDNSGKSVLIDMLPSSGSQFSLGRTNVSITATDASGNKDSCHFTVKVRAIACQDPSLISSLLTYNCTSGHVYGATCDVSCISGYSHGGATSVTCDKVSASNNHLHWVWSGKDAPFCQDFCSPGQKSPTGRKPCQPCPKGSYQFKFNMTHCDLCPYGMSTFFSGATSDSDCQFFDISYETKILFPKHIEIRGNLTSCSVVFRIRLVPRQEQLQRLKFSLHPNDEDSGEASVYISLHTIRLYIMQTKAKNTQSVRKWYHVSLIYDTVGSNSFFRLYVNGILTSSKDNVGPLNLYQKSFSVYGDPVSLFVFEANPIIISAMQVITSALSVEEVEEFATTCFKRLKNNILESNSFDADSVNLSECYAEDFCADDPCSQHATCINWGKSFTCLCDKNWEGERCESPLNFCLNHQCAHGATCVNNYEHSNYTCSCTDAYSGPLCTVQIVDIGWNNWGPWSSCSTSCGLGQRIRERQCGNVLYGTRGTPCPDTNSEEQACFGYQCPVNGGFGEWSDWSPCSVTCGGGVSSRQRYCDNPAPSNGGLGCDKSQAENLQCSSKPCPACSDPLIRQGHQSFECIEGDRFKECHIICKPGLGLVPDIANTFLCGLLTNYTWTHQTEKNPIGILPACSEQQRPLKNEFFVNFTFANVSCRTNSSENDFLTILEENLQKRVICLQNMNCSLTLSLSPCGSLSNEGSLYGTLVFKFTNDTKLRYLSLMTEKERAEEISHAQAATSLMTQLATNPDDFLTFTMNGTTSVGKVTMARALIQCQDGVGFYNGLCVDCPPGSYYAGNGICEMCEQGYYQNKSRMSSCESCPECTTTAGLGSYLSDQCQTNVNLCNTDNENFSSEDKKDTTLPLTLGVVGSVVTALIVLAIIILIFRSKRRNQKPNYPYIIPEEKDEDRDEDPYARIPADDPYDVINEEAHSSGYLTILAPDDVGISSGHIYDKPEDSDLEEQSCGDFKSKNASLVFNNKDLGDGQINFACSEKEDVELQERKDEDRDSELNASDSLPRQKKNQTTSSKGKDNNEYANHIKGKSQLSGCFENLLTNDENTDAENDPTNIHERDMENAPRPHLRKTFHESHNQINDEDYISPL